MPKLIFRFFAFLFWITNGIPTVKAAEISFTLDDPYTTDTVKLTGRERDSAIRKHFQTAKIKAALFVCGMRIDNPKGRELLKAWDDEGHLIANHSFSHKNFNSQAVTADFLKLDIVKGEKLLISLKNFKRLFRFPFLKEGDTAQKRDEIRTFLSSKGYRNGAVTIDASDWYISDRLQGRIKENPQADLSAYRDFYLKHIWERAVYYNELSKATLGREVKHTLLIHHNLLNALYLADLVQMFKSKRWKIIDAQESYKDPVFLKNPSIVPAGEGLIWGIAKEADSHNGKLRYPAEDGEYEKTEMNKLGL